jgi:hypothetical protein
MKAQQMSINVNEGKSPAAPVETGRASIPPPVLVPATNNVAPIKLPA